MTDTAEDSWAGGDAVAVGVGVLATGVGGDGGGREAGGRRF